MERGQVHDVRLWREQKTKNKTLVDRNLSKKLHFFHIYMELKYIHDSILFRLNFVVERATYLELSLGLNFSVSIRFMTLGSIKMLRTSGLANMSCILLSSSAVG